MYTDDKFGQISIWASVDTCSCGEADSLYEGKEMEKLWKDTINPNNFKIINISSRKLPQLNYHLDHTKVSDIIFSYKDKNYVLFANIVCEPYFHGKWHRIVNSVHPFIKELDIAELDYEYIEDSDLYLTKDATYKFVIRDGKILIMIVIN